MKWSLSVGLPMIPQLKAVVREPIPSIGETRRVRVYGGPVSLVHDLSRELALCCLYDIPVSPFIVGVLNFVSDLTHTIVWAKGAGAWLFKGMLPEESHPRGGDVRHRFYVFV